MLQVLNAVLRQYLILPVAAMFMKKLRLEIAEVSRKHLRAFNDVTKLLPSTELMCISQDHLLVLKLHCDVHFDNLGELIASSQQAIVLHDDCSASSNCLHKTNRNRPVKAVIVAKSKGDTYGELDSYLSMVEVFCQHLNIQVLAYSAACADSIHPFICMFDRLAEIEQSTGATYIRSLSCGASAPTFSQVCSKLNAKQIAFPCGNFCFTVVDPQVQKPSIWLYRDRLPWLQFEMDIRKCPSIANHMKYITSSPAKIEGRIKSKFERDEAPFSFIAIVNVTYPDSMEFVTGLDHCFRQLFKELQIIGWRSSKEESLAVRVECLQDLCEMLGLPSHGLLKQLLTKK